MGKLVRDEKDQPVTIQRYSDNLLLALLRAHRPERFRERTSHEHTGSPILLEQIVLLALEKREEQQAARPLVIDATPVSTEGEASRQTVSSDGKMTDTST
jgi:hypothetical protein